MRIAIRIRLSQYSIRCRFRSSQSEIWQTVRVVPRDSYSLTVHGLRPRMRYQFMVLARDQHGVAHFSRIVNVMTTRLTSDSTKSTDHQAQLLFLGFLLSVFISHMLLTGSFLQQYTGWRKKRGQPISLQIF